VDGGELHCWQVAHCKGLALDGCAALVLTVYGAYGIPLETPFNITDALLIARGYVLAWAHVRGGTTPYHRLGFRV